MGILEQDTNVVKVYRRIKRSPLVMPFRRTIFHDNDNLSWYGAIALQKESNWTMPWRLPYRHLDLYPFEELHRKAAAASGIRLKFATDSTSVVVHTEFCKNDKESGNMDIYADGKLMETIYFKTTETSFTFVNLPPGMKVIELWPCQKIPFKLKSIELDATSVIKKVEDKRPKWITYGSSISQCNSARSPSFTWPGIVARKKNLDLISLSFSSQCHADPMIARLIRDTPADLISLKIGINIYGAASFSLRTFRPAIIGTIALIREKHPETPLVICSPIFCGKRENEENKTGLTLKRIREEIEGAVGTFKKYGDKNLYYVNGLKLLGPEYSGNFIDGVHPDAEGYEIMAENFIKTVFEESGIKITNNI